MAERLGRKVRATKSRTTPVVLRPAQTTPISEEDHQQAVTAFATMIASWWHDQHHPPECDPITNESKGSTATSSSPPHEDPLGPL